MFSESTLKQTFSVFALSKDCAAVLGRIVCQQRKPWCCTSCTVNAFYIFDSLHLLLISSFFVWQPLLFLSCSLSVSLSDPACYSCTQTLEIMRGVREVWTLSSQRSVISEKVIWDIVGALLVFFSSLCHTFYKTQAKKQLLISSIAILIHIYPCLHPTYQLL